jgi:hypothetical protein
MQDDLIERLRGLLAKATPTTGVVRPQVDAHGEERYRLIGVPCGFVVASFGDFNDAVFFEEAKRALPALLDHIKAQAAEIERLRALLTPGGKTIAGLQEALGRENVGR